jgi:uncharacterized membrane protein YdbT with pleckstrin-like domain
MQISSRERILYETRRHVIVLAGSLLKALVVVAVGGTLLELGWPWSIGGVVAMAIAALVSLRAVWRWDRTKLVLTKEQLCVVYGLLRRRSAVVRLSHLGPIELEQTLPGRMLDYGTLIAGDLEVDFVPEPWELQELVAELAGSKLAA